ncbi:MAG: hypothetical protein ACRCYT_02020 [Cetobacterium sp.]
MEYYEQTVRLPHNKKIISVDVETGDMQDIPKRINNIPKGKSKLDYERYHISNDNFIKKALSMNLITNEELGIITHMSSIAEINTNSLRPLTDKTTLKDLSERFQVPIKRVEKIFKKLFSLGVYSQLNYFSYSENQEVTYWVLNPYISWKGNLRNDSIFNSFVDTMVYQITL